MSLESRLKKIEGLAGIKVKEHDTLIIVCKNEEDREKKLKEYYEKYGEDAEGKLIIIIPTTDKD